MEQLAVHYTTIQCLPAPCEVVNILHKYHGNAGGVDTPHFVRASGSFFARLISMLFRK